MRYLLLALALLLPVELGAQAVDTVYVTVIDTATTVVIQPVADTVALPASIQLVAQVTDGAGNPVVPDSLVWTSLAPSVATVSPTGLVTFLAPGSMGVEVKAFRGGDVPPDPPVDPPPDTTAVGLFYAQDFEGEIVGQAPVGGGLFSWGSPAGGTAVSDDVALSGTKSLKFPIPQSATPGANYNNEMGFHLGRQIPEVWLEYWLYYPDGTEGISGVGEFRQGEDPVRSDNDKFIRIWGDQRSYNGIMGASTWFLPTDPDDSTLRPETTINGQGMGTMGMAVVNPFITDARRGEWIQMRLHFKKDTGVADGELHVWIDGVLLSENEDLDLRGLEPMENNYFNRGYFFGAANSGSPNDSAIYMDDLKFFDLDPGW